MSAIALEESEKGYKNVVQSRRLAGVQSLLLGPRAPHGEIELYGEGRGTGI